MPTPNTALLLERFNEIAAIAAVEQQLKQLHALSNEPSSKRYARSRPQRHSIWSELELTAMCAVERTKAVVTPPRPVKRAKPAPTPAAPPPASEPATAVA